MTKNLPNHRVRLDVQIAMLLTFARLSAGQRPIGSAEVADALKVSTNTVSLSSGFYVDSGWLERRGREEFVATESLLAYRRWVESRPNADAVPMLAAPARSSWYWQILEPGLRTGSLSRYDASVLLATAGGTAEEHRPQLEGVLEWLEFLELIHTDGDEVFGSPPTPGDSSRTSAQPADRDGPADPDNVVVAFEIDVRLTAADLVALRPDQIRALFEAIGVVTSLMRHR
jgi:hypothetical protein